MKKAAKEIGPTIPRTRHAPKSAGAIRTQEKKVHYIEWRYVKNGGNKPPTSR